MLRRPSDTENKLLLLYAVDRLGPLTAQQLLTFMTENETMDYISLQLGLAELADARLLSKQPHALGMMYTLTNRGRESLEMFEHKVPFSRKATINANVEAWRRRFRQERQIISDFKKLSPGDYVVRLQLLEKDAHLFDLSIHVPTHKMAQGFCDAWIGQAADVYHYIVCTLGEARERAGSGE